MAESVLKLFHGTSWETAKAILRDGFIESEDGLLGPGVYVAREDKARNFAMDRMRHRGQEGGLVSVLVTVRRAKFVRQNDSNWQSEGYDACRADETTFSNSMEWCVKDRSQLEVIAVEKVAIDDHAEPVELLPSPPPVNETFVVSCICLSGHGIAVRKSPEYPGEDARTGIVIRGGDSVTCQSVQRGSNNRFLSIPHMMANGRKVDIHFFRLRDGSGWIHDFDSDAPHQRLLHEHASQQSTISLEPPWGEVDPQLVGTELRSVPAYPGDEQRNGVIFRTGDVAIADSNFVNVRYYSRSTNQDVNIRFYRLTDGFGWVHDFDDTRHSARKIKAVPFDEKEEPSARRQLAKLDAGIASLYKERKSVLDVVSRFEKQQESAALRTEEARQHRLREQQKKIERRERKERKERDERRRRKREEREEKERCERKEREEKERLEREEHTERERRRQLLEQRTCSACRREFKNRSSMLQHHRDTHEFRCTRCHHRTFKSSAALAQHVAAKHSRTFHVGDRVSYCHANGAWYDAEIEYKNTDGSYDVVDRDDGERHDYLGAVRIQDKKWFKVGDLVWCADSDGEDCEDGEITYVNDGDEDATYDVEVDSSSPRQYVESWRLELNTD